MGLLNLSKLAVNIFGVILLFAFHPKTWGSRLIFSDVICGSLSVAVCGSYSPMSSFRCRVFHFSRMVRNATISCLSFAAAAAPATSNVEDRVKREGGSEKKVRVRPVQGSAKRRIPGCVNFAGKARQKYRVFE